MKHLIFSSKLIAILFVVSSMMYIGCQKEEIKREDTQGALSTELRTTVAPTVENGTLKFETEEDAYNYMRQLEQELQSESNTILSDQSQLGFTSRLSIVRDLGEDNPNGSIFSAPYLNAMLNSNYEVMIGDKVYVQKNHQETWIAPKTDAVALAVFREKQPGSFIEDTEILPSMIIDGKREIEMMMTCCTRYGKRTSFQTRLHNGALIRLGGEVEITRGKLWGIFVFARADAKKNGQKNSSFNLEAKVFGRFRDKNCTLLYTDADDDFCHTCGSKAVSIFYRKSSIDRFKDGEVRGNLRLYLGQPGNFLWVDIFPSCS